jgi:hypothetical protein
LGIVPVKSTYSRVFEAKLLWGNADGIMDAQVVLRWMYMFDEDELAGTDDVNQHA